MATRLFTGQSRLRPKISDITGHKGRSSATLATC